MRFTSLRTIDATTALEAHHLAQVVALGSVLDGSELTLEERLAAGWYEPALCDVVDETGRARYEVWTCDVDCGAVFFAGTTTLIAPMVQGGFASPDLGVWAELALAQSPPASVSWSINPEGGPVLIAFEPGCASLSGLPRFALGPAWPAVVDALDDEVLRRFLLASSGARTPGLKGLYGPAATFDVNEVEALEAKLRLVPLDALARLADPFESVRRYGIKPGDGIELEWFETQLMALRALLERTVGARQALAVVTT